MSNQRVVFHVFSPQPMFVLLPHAARLLTTLSAQSIRSAEPSDFRFWILRHGSVQVLDFRLSEEKSAVGSKIFVSCPFSAIQNRQSKNLKFPSFAYGSPRRSGNRKDSRCSGASRGATCRLGRHPSDICRSSP